MDQLDFSTNKTRATQGQHKDKYSLAYFASHLSPAKPLLSSLSWQIFTPPWWRATETNKRRLRKMWAIKWDDRPPAGKKLGARGERGTDNNKTGWRGRNLFDLSHCGKQNSWRSPAVVKLLFFFIIGMHFAVSPSERNGNNFQQAGSFLAFRLQCNVNDLRGKKEKKKKSMMES